MHPDLYAAIRSTPAASTSYDANDNAGVVTAINEKTIRQTDSTLRSARWMIATFGAETAGLILGTIKAAGVVDPVVDAGYLSLNSEGLDLSHSTVQQMVDMLAQQGSWPTDLTAAIKAKGVWFISPAMQRIGRDATVQDILDVRAWWAGVENVRILRQRLVSVFDVVMAEVQDQTLTTESACRARFMELLSA